jgi:hypothetical protein
MLVAAMISSAGSLGEIEWPNKILRRIPGKPGESWSISTRFEEVSSRF